MVEMDRLRPHFRGFREGLPASLRGAAFLLRRPRLVAWCAIPWAINLLVVLPLVTLLMANVVYPWLVGMLPQEEDETMKVVLRTGGRILFAIAAFGAGAGVFLISALAIGAPFHDRLGELIERELLAARPDLIAPPLPIKTQILHAVAEAARRVLVAFPLMMLGLGMALVPGIGTVASALFSWWIAATFLALDAFSMPMDRRRVRMPQKMEWLRANRSYAFGFGLPMTIIPCAFFLMPPIATAAASIAYCEKLLAAPEPPGEEPANG